MGTIAENLQTIQEDVSSIKENLGLSSSASLSDIVTKTESVIEPTGTISITENGTVDVTNYASASVNVSGGPITQEEYEIDLELARSILQDSVLPYYELEYIQSTGTQYINTGYHPNQNTKIDIVMEPIDWGDFKNPFGVRTATYINNAWVYTNRFALWLYENKNVYFHIGYDEERIIYSTSKDYTKVKFHLVAENGSVSIQDLTNNSEAEIYTFTPVGNFLTDYSLLLGAMTNDGTSAFNLCKHKLNSCKIYENNVLVRDYIPAKDKVTNEVGLYDKIGEKLYTSSSESEYIAGGVV